MADDSDEETETDPFSFDDTSEISDAVSEKMEELPQTKIRKTKRKTREIASADSSPVSSRNNKRLKIPRLSLTVNDTDTITLSTSGENSETESEENYSSKRSKSPRIPRVISSKIPNLFTKDEKVKEETRSAEQSPSLSPRVTRKERANEKFALQKKLVQAELIYANMSQQKKKLEAVQDHWFSSTVAMKKELSGVKQANLKLQSQVKDINEENEKLRVQLANRLGSGAAVGSCLERSVATTNDGWTTGLRKGQDQQFLSFLLQAAAFTLLLLAVGL
eukprot:CAMPEP_0117041570 /NCGR_PEP_ID=MMETSP0472-20121206/29017_1 /TAXON_ID=693140 ORGANISM="Tiarina fusus, Strain LIS" /NCGR_SAMPLE_ID=MMETSP0472 /ASSEMBLY_ACC=CAM_ASM_000603 /LENGTH=276 /DNA_ID=CAMNT_0004752605 /DNA_START=355 /DNA_END=1185 /DNA_ORIENTATION=-